MKSSIVSEVRAFIVLLAVSLAELDAPAQIVFSDDFDGIGSPVTLTAPGTSSGYNVLYSAASGPVDFTAIFGFDYSTVTSPGTIPSAPNSTGGTTRGLRLAVNKDGTGANTAVNLFPVGVNVSGNFALKFDMWINWVGAVGSTEHALFGINHSGTVTNRPGAAGSDGLFFAVDGDGGVSPTSTTSRDYSVFRGGGAAAAVLMLPANTTFGPTPVLGPQFDNTNTAYVALLPPSGMAGVRWVTCEVRQETNVITWSLNGTIAAQYTNTFAYSAGNVMFGYSDLFGTSIGDAADFVIFDNISVTNLGGPAIVTVTSPQAVANEAGPVSGQFTFARAGDLSGPLTVSYNTAGTADNGVDYSTLSGSITFATGAATTNLTLTPVDDSDPELLEPVVLSVAGGVGYNAGSPAITTVSIIDNDPATISIAPAQSVLLEGHSGGRATDTVTRRGLTNSALTVNIAYSGSATAGADFNSPATVSIPAGAATATLTSTRIDDNLMEGNETEIITVVAGTGYGVGSPASATNTVVDDDALPGVALFLDTFDTATSSTNWVVNQSSGDAFAQFGYDYSAVGIPEAVSSFGSFSPTKGLRFRANETAGALAGISASPLNGNFGPNYRLRFDMWLNYSGPFNLATVTGTTQAGSAGVGTTGIETMWPGGTATEGVWFSATSDGGSASAAGDYNAYAGVNLAVDVTGVYAAGTTGSPRDNLNAYYTPWASVTAPAAQLALFPSQTNTTPTGAMGMTWHKCVITRHGNNILWDIDGRRMATVDASAFSLSTNIFVGYHDPFTSIATNLPVQFGLFDNVRVETLSRPKITSLVYQGTTVVIDFMGEDGDTTGEFEIQASGNVTGTYLPVSATITQLSPTTFEAVVPTSGSSAFFQVKRL